MATYGNLFESESDEEEFQGFTEQDIADIPHRNAESDAELSGESDLSFGEDEDSESESEEVVSTWSRNLEDINLPAFEKDVGPTNTLPAEASALEFFKALGTHKSIDEPPNVPFFTKAEKNKPASRTGDKLAETIAMSVGACFAAMQNTQEFCSNYKNSKAKAKTKSRYSKSKRLSEHRMAKKEHLLAGTRMPDHCFQQDNDPKHTSKKAQEYYRQSGINWWPTPPESPDLYPIECVWNQLKYHLRRGVKPSNKEELVLHDSTNAKTVKQSKKKNKPAKERGVPTSVEKGVPPDVYPYDSDETGSCMESESDEDENSETVDKEATTTYSDDDEVECVEPENDENSETVDEEGTTTYSDDDEVECVEPENDENSETADNDDCVEDESSISIEQGIPNLFEGSTSFTLPYHIRNQVDAVMNGLITFGGSNLITMNDLQGLLGNASRPNGKWVSNFVIDEYLKLIKSASVNKDHDGNDRMGFVCQLDVGDVDLPSTWLEVLDLLKENFATSMIIRALSEVLHQKIVIITVHGEEDYVKIIEPRMTSGNLFFAHSGCHYVALKSQVLLSSMRSKK
ncbi:hypothetical protein QZH41_002968 [Actinostola sp. cb2023]|nr:hypothetical protein QZH41_002968 [Actinostola sp. cb2023]